VLHLSKEPPVINTSFFLPPSSSLQPSLTFLEHGAIFSLASSPEFSSAALFRSVSNASRALPPTLCTSWNQSLYKTCASKLSPDTSTIARNDRNSCFDIAVGHCHAAGQPQSPCQHYPRPTPFALGLNSWPLCCRICSSSTARIPFNCSPPNWSEIVILFICFPSFR
jgi:hypothetical protein